jgi:hypothetical protein
MKDFGLADLSSIPTRNRNLNEGRHYLELILLQCMHFFGPAVHAQDKGTIVHLLSCLDTAKTLGEGGLYYLAFMQQWHDAFKHILNHAGTAAGKANFLLLPRLWS